MEVDEGDDWEKVGGRRRRALADAPPLLDEIPEPRGSHAPRAPPKRNTRFLEESLEHRKGLSQLDGETIAGWRADISLTVRKQMTCGCELASEVWRTGFF